MYGYGKIKILSNSINRNLQGEYNMDGRIIGFIVWALCGCLMIGLGIGAFFSKKAVGFWANIKTFPVNDIRGYNSCNW